MANGYTTISGVDAPTVAKAFCKLLRAELTTEQMTQVVQRNIEESSDAICHSHDFCDANVVMADACEELGIEILFPADEPDEELMQIQCNLWNEAWSLAKRADFDADMIDEIVIDIAQNGY